MELFDATMLTDISVLHQTGGSVVAVFSVRHAASSLATSASLASTRANESVPSCTRNGGLRWLRWRRCLWPDHRVGL
jgi:hypothetical protein